jgi:tetratricopeptide (TPR) repeat protein
MTSASCAVSLRERIWELLGKRDPISSSEAFALADELPPPPQSPDDLTAHCIFDIGFELERLGEDTDALAQYRRVLTYTVSNPKYRASAWFRIGVCLARQGNYGEALECYRKSLETADNLPHLEALAHFYLAELLEAAEEYQEACESYAQALRMLPHPDINTPRAKLAYGRCSWRTGNHDEALAVFRSLALDSGEAHSAEAWQWLAEIAERRGELAVAAEAQREIVRSPHSEPSWRAMAVQRLSMYG